MNPAASQQNPHVCKALAFTALLLVSTPLFAQTTPQFTPGNLVVLVEGCGVYAGTCVNVPNGTGTGIGNSSVGGYGDNQGAPLTLFQYAPTGTTAATYVNSLVLPQTASGANLPVSSEYGSSSEGTLQLSGSGQFLTLAGYGIDAATFDANPATYGAAPSLALAQSGSLTGQSYTPVARVIALVDANGNVRSSSALYNIFNLNNPRSVYTLNGATAYISGQGSGSDATGGVFYTPLGGPNTAPTAITGLDTTNNTIAQDTRTVKIYNGTLYVSADSKAGSNAARDYVGTLGPAGTPPTSTVGAPVALPGFATTGKVTITSGPNSNGNGSNAGLQINISSSNYFFANPATLYIADTGNPKNNSASSPVGNGGLEKWINTAADGSGTWSLAYTLSKGLNLVPNNSGTGTSGLYGLTGAVSNGAVQLYATSNTLSDLDPTYLFGVTDTLAYTTASQAAAENFTQLAAAPSDSNFKGVSFAPTAAAPVTPVITWTPPSPVTFGSALSGEQLNATATTPGTFVYNPPAGTVLTAGANQTLSVTFTPTDPINFNAATASTTITVNPAATTPANLVVTRTLTRSSGNIVVQLTISDTGGTAATGIVLTGVKVGGVAATPTPQSIGTIAAGSSAIATVTLPAPGTSGTASSLTVTGTYNGGTFTSSARITLP